MMKDFKIGIIVDCLKLGIEQGITQAAAMGVDGIQVYAVSGEMAPGTLTRTRRIELLDRIKSSGLVVSAVCGDLGGYGFAKRCDHATKIEMSKKIMELAKDLESSIVTTHVGVIPDNPNERYETLLEACRRLGGIAEEAGGVFAIETGSETTATLRGFLKDVASRGVGVNYDPANLVMVTGEDPVRGVAALGSHIVHTHAKDGIMIRQGDPETIYDAFAEPGSDWIHFADYFKETPLGQGGVDFPGYLKALADIGYKGFLTIEREVGSRPLEDVREAVRFLRTILSRQERSENQKENRK